MGFAMHRFLASTCFAAFVLTAAIDACALSPERVFEVASQSVVVVEVLDRQGNVSGSGSGVIVAPELVATNCHVAVRGELVVRYRGARFSAIRVKDDRERDLCLVQVRGLDGRPAALATGRPKPGSRVYSLGAPKGLELTIAEGLVSGVRELGNSYVIQTSAPISPGSSGGGLFDSDARLVGVTTMYLADSQNLNFAAPAEWITDLLRGRGAEDYRLMADAVQAALALRKFDHSPPQRRIADPDERIEYIDWLNEMSGRLLKVMPDYRQRIEFLRTLDYEAIRAGLDRQLALALIDVLSGFKGYSVDASGSRGLLLVAPYWTRRIGDGDEGKLFDVRVNLRYGYVILRHYLDVNGGDLHLALEDYADDAFSRHRVRPRSAEFPNKVVERWQGRWAYQPRKAALSQRAPASSQAVKK